jgi:hypothetical protein
MRASEFITEAWSEKYKRSINCSNPKGFSQKAHCQGRKKTDEEIEQLDEKCWDTHKQVGMKKKGNKMVPNCVPKESVSEVSYPGNIGFHEVMNFYEKASEIEKTLFNVFMKDQDYKKAWELVQRVVGTRLHGNEFDDTGLSNQLVENLRNWFKEKWVRFGPDGKIRGDCARGSEGEGKPKCLPQKKAHSLGKKKRASAASRKRKQDPNPERQGKAKNVATKSTRDKK